MIERVTEAQIRRELTRYDEKTARRRAGIATAFILAAALLAGSLASWLLFSLTDIRSDGMSGTLNGGDVVVCVRSDAPLLAAPAVRGSLALVRYSESGIQRQSVRRVIALAGDEVSVDAEGRVTLNGEALEEPYATYRSQSDWNGGEARPGGALENPFAEGQSDAAPAVATEAAAGVDDMDYPLTVPDGTVFVLCDNRDNLLDSRSSRFGQTRDADILGLVKAVVWPVYRARLTGDP